MIPPIWKCPKRIGFLFPHPCELTTPVDCPHCLNGQIDDPYRERSRPGYDNFDDYGDEDSYLGSSAAGSDFTEADGAMLVQPVDDFEDDMTES